MSYFNYSTFWPADWWGRRSFARAWWSIYAGDSRWVPPDHAIWQRLATRSASPLWRDERAQPIYMEALPRRSGTGSPGLGQPLLAGAVFEEAVAAAILHFPPAHGDGTAYLGLLRCVNDEETLERLLGASMEAAAGYGCVRLVGPVGPIPAWESGALSSHFHTTPPLHTPYNPPYLPDLLASTMTPLLETTLYHLPVRQPQDAADSPAQLEPLTAAQIDSSLAPLIAAALAPHSGVPDVSPREIDILRQWLSAWPSAGWLAKVDGQAAGIVLAQPDHAPLERQTRGGRRLPWRWYAAWARRRPAAGGRLLLGAVAPAWRSRGIGQQLLAQVLRHAHAGGWQALACGPYAPGSDGARLVERFGAEPAQRYAVYEWSAW